MSRFSYFAKNLSGVPKHGFLEAENKQELARVLRKEGYVLISAKSEGKSEFRKKIDFFFSIFSIFSRISLVDKIMFARNLQVMIASGVSFPRALNVLAEQARSKKFKKVILSISQEVIGGKNFSDILLDYPNVFSETFSSMVKAGEESGKMEEVLSVLTRQMEREHELKSKIKGAMIYPAVIIIAMVIIGISMMILVVPKLAQTFEELGIELPITTRIVIGTGVFLADYWYLIPVVIFAVFIFFRIFLKTKTGKNIIDFYFLKIPVIGPLIIKTNSAYTVRTLSSLISAGVPIVKSLEIVSGVLNNVYYKRAVLNSLEEVKKGAKLSESLGKYKDIYPVLVVQMIAVGEETGETSAILEKLANFFEEEVTNAAKNLSSIIEPVLMLIVGAAVGFFAISMIQPIYGMMKGL